QPVEGVHRGVDDGLEHVDGPEWTFDPGVARSLWSATREQPKAPRRVLGGRCVEQEDWKCASDSTVDQHAGFLGVGVGEAEGWEEVRVTRADPDRIRYREVVRHERVAVLVEVELDVFGKDDHA